MSKMGSHDPFGHLKHKLWPKKRSGIELAIWLLTTKSQESTRFPCVQVACRCCTTYRWKDFDEGYNFALNLISIRGLHEKLWAPKVAEVLVMGISRLSNGSIGTKCHLDVGLVKRHKVYYKGEGGGFPQVRVVVSFVNLNCLWLVLTPKVL